MVRTRFAPSPTGFLHVGGVRTNFFAWLYARHCGGKFVLRIEDTDQERLVPGAVEAILCDLKWLGIEIDEGPSQAELGIDRSDLPDLTGPFKPYLQSKRLDRYKEISNQLIESGHAYRCDCTAEMLKKERQEQQARRETPGYSGYCRSRNVSADTKHVVRLKIPTNPDLVLEDAVKGKIRWESLSLRDPVLMKSDGFPTYHLAVVVDDHDMEISHVMRGEEWIATTPIHLMVYQALGWAPPTFCHLPSVLGEDGKKLSKRHGSTSISTFREQGYLPEAMLNFLALIGWSPGEGEEREIFSIEEIIERFSLEHINSASGVFSYAKLDWMNGQYIRKLSPSDLQERLDPFLREAGLDIDSYPDRLEKIIPHIQERLKVLTEAAPQLEFLFNDQIEPQIDQMLSKHLDRENAAKVLVEAHGALGEIEFNVVQIEKALKGLVEKMGVKTGALLGAVRVAVLGKKATPPLFESLEVLGKELSLQRLLYAKDKLS